MRGPAGLRSCTSVLSPPSAWGLAWPWVPGQSWGGIMGCPSTLRSPGTHCNQTLVTSSVSMSTCQILSVSFSTVDSSVSLPVSSAPHRVSWHRAQRVPVVNPVTRTPEHWAAATRPPGATYTSSLVYNTPWCACSEVYNTPWCTITPGYFTQCTTPYMTAGPPVPLCWCTLNW